jgi:hypothetical protein
LRAKPGYMPGSCSGGGKSCKRAPTPVAFSPVAVAPVPEATAPPLPVPSPEQAGTVEIEFATRGRMQIGRCVDGVGAAQGAGQDQATSMIPVPTGVRVWLATGHTDMRKSFASLSLQVGGVAPRPAVRTSVLLPRTPRQPVEGDLARRARRVPVHEAFGTRSLSVAAAGGLPGDDLVGPTGLPALASIGDTRTWRPTSVE